MNKQQIAALFDRYAPERDKWRRGSSYYQEALEQLCREVIPPGKSVLDLGCGTGDLLAAVRPRLGVGVDLSRGMLERARAKYPAYNFIQGDAEQLPVRTGFEYVIMSDLAGHLGDIWTALRNLRQACADDTTVILTYYNFVWQPLITFAEKFGLKMAQQRQNWLGLADIQGLFELAGFSIVQSGVRLLVPARVPLIADRLNRDLDRKPWARWAGLIQFVVARPDHNARLAKRATCSVIVPCRNEAGNIAACVERLPAIGEKTELIFVDGDSTDGTVEEIESQINRWRGRLDIKLLKQAESDTQGAVTKNQDGVPANRMLRLGKGDAVRKGFAVARGDVLMILDADLTVPPEDLPKFFAAITEGHGELINGTRLIYPIENEAMKFVNLLGNKLFSWVFTWLLGQRIKDTLCGTKVLFKRDYEKIAMGRSYFGDFDPFGDFDLLFGASRCGLKIVEMPVRYRRRSSGESKVRVIRHGLLLIRMCLIGFWKLKVLPLAARRGRETRSHA